jgi:UDP-3-O-[3-hydroxymyristoyl] N-acetylglucosamine deacetylase
MTTERFAVQATLKKSASFKGVGLHGGKPVTLTIHPSVADSGIWFNRVDVRDADPLIPARYDAVPESRLCTKICNADGVSVSTIEHLMAALAGCGIHNARVDIDAEEVPILDGSAVEFVRGLLAAGIAPQDRPIYAIEILKKVTVLDGDSEASLSPASHLTMAFSIDFPDPAIGVQHRHADLANGRFVRELCDSRTFCRQSDVEAMWNAGLALGGSYDNAVVVDGDDVLSPGGFRHADEAVRHKMLDALGDLALAGNPILGHYEGVRAGHMLTNRLLRALFAMPDAMRLVQCDAKTAAHLPGMGVGQHDLAHVA